MAARLALAAGDSVTMPWLITWYFPVVEHWNKPKCDCGTSARPPTWRNWYASQWRDAWDVARYVADNFRRLHDDTVLFHETLFSSTLPPHVLDAVSANISILKTTTCLRLPDGTFYAFEGCSNTAGCCEGSCTHVWNYAQALPFLFPALQRSQRELGVQDLDARRRVRPVSRPAAARRARRISSSSPPPTARWAPSCRSTASGSSPATPSGSRASGRSAKKALEFAWKYWDADRDGVMEGMQHNTYDIEFYGPNSLMQTLYLGALRAAEEMARAVGDDAVRR